MDYNFEVIPNEQTPVAPDIDNVTNYIKDNQELILEFGKYADSRKDAIGLAANQCSLNKKRLNTRIISIRDIKTGKSQVAIYPWISDTHGMLREKKEGCLTWKGKTVVAQRYYFIEVSYYTPDGELKVEALKGLQAQVWQHEINHINGIEEDVREGWVEPVKYDIGRNETCPCGSGKKYKKCCIEND